MTLKDKCFFLNITPQKIPWWIKGILFFKKEICSYDHVDRVGGKSGYNLYIVCVKHFLGKYFIVRAESKSYINWIEWMTDIGIYPMPCKLIVEWRTDDT